MSLDLGPFELIAPHARGGMAEIWRARHRLTGRSVAVKVMTLAATRPASWRAQFGREVRAVARVAHPAVVRVHDHGLVPGVVASQTGRLGTGAPYLVMEWLDGGPIDTGPAAKSWPALMTATRTLLDGLALAHARGVIHRDIKPDNVLLAERGPVLTDFGLALDGDFAGSRLIRAGTPGYMAPEQIEARPHLEGPATDLYAMGCLVWALATGTPPHHRPDLPPMGLAMAHLYQPLPAIEARFPVPPGLSAWLSCMLARDARARFAYAADALKALRAWTAPGSVPEPIERRVPADWRRGSGGRHRPELQDVGNAMLAHRVPPAVGREAARDRLWSALGAVTRTGGMHTRCIIGQSGLGKTHLVDWLSEQAHRLGVAWVLRARHGDTHDPGFGLRPMLARGVAAHRIPPDTWPTGLSEAVDRQLPLDATDIERAEAMALIDPDGRGVSGGVHIALRTPGDWDDAFIRALRTLGRLRPVLMVIDDLQWGPATRRTLRALFAASPPPPVLIVATVRTDVGSQTDAVRVLFDRAHRIELGPLTPAEHRTLLAHTLPLDRAALDVLVDRARGSPLVATEWLRHWLDGGALMEGPRGYRLAPGAEVAPPETIEAVWANRLDGVLGPLLVDAREALEIGAVLGNEIDTEVWLEACGHAGVPWPAEAINRLLDGGLLREVSGARLRFVHAMLRETLNGWARRGGRWLALNACCARVFEHRIDRGASTDLTQLAHHLIAAEEHAAALDALSAACRRAIGSIDLEAAAPLVSRQATLLRRLRAPRRDVRWIPILLDAARIDRYRGRYEPARRRAQRVLRHPAIGSDPALHCRALHVLSAIGHETGGPQRPMRALEMAMPLAEQSGDRTLLARQLALFGLNAVLLHRVSDAEDALDRGLSIAASDDHERRAYLFFYRAMAAGMRGDTARGVTAAHAARRAFRAAGQIQNVVVTWSVESGLHRRADRLEDAHACIRRADAMSIEPRPATRAYQALHRGLLAIAEDRWSDARPLIDDADGYDIGPLRVTVTASRALVFAGKGRWADADAIIDTVDAMLDDAPASDELPWLAQRLVDVARAADHLGGAAAGSRWRVWHRRRLDAEERRRHGADAEPTANDTP